MKIYIVLYKESVPNVLEYQALGHIYESNNVLMYNAQPVPKTKAPLSPKHYHID